MKSFGQVFLQQFMDRKNKEEKEKTASYSRLEINYRKALKDKDYDKAEMLKKILDAVDANQKGAA